MAADDSTRNVFEHHLGAFGVGLDAIMDDYGDESVLLTADQDFIGPAQIRGFFEHFIGTIPAGFWDAFKIHKSVVRGEVAFLVWEAKPWVALANDTLLVRDGKILVQTFVSATSAP